MILYINTSGNNLMEIAVKSRNKTIAAKKIKSHRSQAEKLLPAVEKLLKANKLKLKNLSEIEVENRGGSFTSLRIGVITANALAYALGIPIVGSGGKGKKIVEPIYDREPEITKKKSG
ncbi:MAG: tRNA (adenosine(37)-N6)-threonylcarbamoyltransferase complex dimerization subunit type 1 TsaB [bacterium]